jgi:hypothetical protein
MLGGRHHWTDPKGVRPATVTDTTLYWKGPLRGCYAHKTLQAKRPFGNPVNSHGQILIKAFSTMEFGLGGQQPFLSLSGTNSHLMSELSEP